MILGTSQVKIQSGATSIATGGTEVTATITEVKDIRACVVTAFSRVGNSVAYLKNTTTIAVNCSAAGEVRWQIAEFGGAYLE